MTTYSINDAWQAYTAQKGLAALRGRYGNLQGVCEPQETREQGYWPYPWVEMPPGGLPFDEFASIVTPAANSTETLVLSYPIPFGYDGIILAVTNLFTGPGFVEGSGNLIWRIRIGAAALQGTPVRNYSNIRNTLGSLQQPRTVFGGILVESDQTLQYTVTHAIGSPIVPAGTRIICNVAGFYWPRGGSPMRYT